jgi:UDP-glucose 4-epimerase
VKFEQYSTYYYNRLKVICGLIQASLVRAAMFSNANYQKMHLSMTRILNHQAFMDELKIRVEMRKNRVSDFQLVMMENPNKSMQEIYPRISGEIRNRDIIGVGANGDYFILLSQADPLSAQDIAERLTRFGFPSKIIETSQVLTD